MTKVTFGQSSLIVNVGHSGSNASPSFSMAITPPPTSIDKTVQLLSQAQFSNLPLPSMSYIPIANVRGCDLNDGDSRTSFPNIGEASIQVVLGNYPQNFRLINDVLKGRPTFPPVPSSQSSVMHIVQNRDMDQLSDCQLECACNTIAHQIYLLHLNSTNARAAFRNVMGELAFLYYTCFVLKMRSENGVQITLTGMQNSFAQIWVALGEKFAPNADPSARDTQEMIIQRLRNIVNIDRLPAQQGPNKDEIQAVELLKAMSRLTK